MALRICRSGISEHRTQERRERLPIDNWSDIRIFLAVLRHGSTLAAARDLGVTQTTVARRIDGLEHVLGLTLFVRDTRGFHPTGAARALIPAAEAMAEAARDLGLRAEELVASDQQLIRITSAHEPYVHVLSVIIEEFRAAHPEVRFENATTDAQLDMDKGESDVAFRHAHRVNGSQAIVTRLGEEIWGLYCSETYAKEHGTPSADADIRNHQALLFGGNSIQVALTAWLRENADPGRITAHCESLSSMLSMLNSGLGVGPMVLSLAQAQDPPLVHCLTPPVDESTPSWLVVSPQAQKRKIVRDFADFARRRYRDYYRTGFGFFRKT